MLWALPVALSLGLVAAGCATNPATGQKQLNFYSKAQEIEIGRQSDREVSAQLGLVDDSALQAWVGEIGGRLAAQSERPDLPWSFKVVDDPVVNAFALPGGFIYVTRGILGHLSSDAELAAVLGHEIGHVTAQHGVNQMSKQQLATGGLMLGMILSPDLARAGDLAQTGLGLFFLKFSRDDERQADDLGMRYMVKTGFEVREMPKVFDVLRRVSEGASEGGRIPNWLSTHPDPVDRQARSERLIRERAYPAGEVAEADYFRHIDGLTYGADPRQGYFEGDRFYHPGLAFQFSVPHGWAAQNESSRVIAVHPEKIAQIELRLASEKSADAAAQKFLAQQGLEVGSQSRLRINGLAAVDATFRVPREGASALHGEVGFVELGGSVFQLLGLTLEDKAKLVEADLRSCLRSFAALKERSRIAVEPRRIRVVELPRAMSFDEFLRAYPSGADAKTVALVNAVDDTRQALPAGTHLKRIVGQEVGRQSIGGPGS